MVDNMLVSIKCIMCEMIIGWVKHIVLKRDNLGKHMGKQQANHDIPSKGLKKNEIYYDKIIKHVQNLALLSILLPLSILQQVGNDVVGESWCKIV